MSQRLKKVGLTIGAVWFVINSAPRLTLALDYPELVVAPRASERVQMEASREKGRVFDRMIPIQVSAATTLVSAVLMRGDTDSGKDPDSRASLAGIIVGAGWLGATLALDLTYRPYAKALAEIEKLPARTDREKLVRERLAEEALEGAACLGRRLSLLSSATNLGASIYMIAKSEKNSLGLVASAVSAAVSLTPLVFPLRWSIVEREQREYKKRVYGPLSAELHPVFVSAHAASARTAPRVGAGLGLSVFF